MSPPPKHKEQNNFVMKTKELKVNPLVKKGKMKLLLPNLDDAWPAPAELGCRPA
jgi:hypothetical protein